jgi:hypothetical protein
VYEVGVFPSMTKGEIVGQIVIHVLSLMSTVYQSAEDVKQYDRKIKAQKEKNHCTVYQEAEEIRDYC